MADDTPIAAEAPAPKTANPRDRVVDAMFQLAAERRFEEISIRDIAAAANVSLADFRDLFPSKGAVLGAFNRRIDRLVLGDEASELSGEAPRERLFDVLMRRFDAMAPYKSGLKEVVGWLRRDPIAASRFNQPLLNSMRFMLEAAGIDSEGLSGALKLQGFALTWVRLVDVWLEDSDPDLSKTMAALDRELTRGEKLVSGVEQLDRLTAPLHSIARAAFDRASARRGKTEEAAPL